MREIINVDERTRLRHMDPMNWTVDKLCDVKRKDGTEAREWRVANGASGPFAGRPDSPAIVACLLDNAPELDGFEGTLQEHARAVDAASHRIAASIKELNEKEG